MKVPANNIDGTIARLNPSLLGALVYGPDVGLVKLRAQVIARQIVKDPKDPFLISDLAPSILKEDPSRLADEMKAIGFGGGRRLVVVSDAGNEINHAVKQLINDPDAEQLCRDAFLLVTGGELMVSSGLRKAFESEKNLVSIPCYVEDARALGPIISDALRQQKLAFEQDVIHYLAMFCQGDRMIVLQEIEKLKTYMGDQVNVTLEDVVACVGQSTEASLDDICQAVADGNQKLAHLHVERAWQQGVAAIAILRSLQRYFLRLQDVQGSISEGRTVPEAVKALRPPIFFKQVRQFENHANRWIARKRVSRALEELYQAEYACKQTGSQPELTTSRCLMRLAAMV